ncbi:MAG: tetratricopeptide repeat protein [Thermodesulfobacteriota bacterium]|nr:tetratricopeptide repeat protein [Thermodesulfobacteriota bacterium]
MSKIRLLVVVLFLSLLAVSCSTDASGPASYIQKGNDFKASHNYKQAVAAYQQAVSRAPDKVAAWSGMGDAYLKLGKTQASIDAYRHVLELDPRNTGALLRLARFDLLGNRYDEASKKVETVLDDQPANTEALFLRADIYQQQEHLKQAAVTYETILEASPSNKKAYLRLADVQARQGNAAGAEDTLKDAIRVAPDTTAPRLMLFNLYNQRREYEKAEAVLNDAVEAAPENGDLYAALGRFYFSRGKTAAAEHAFKTAIRKSPEDVSMYLLAGNFYSATGNSSQALSMYKAALAKVPRNPRIMAILVDYYLETGKTKPARDYIEKILNERPGYFPARLLDIRLLIQEDRHDEAIKRCERLFKDRPLSDELFRLKGLAYLEKGDLEQAKSAFARAVEISPGNINARIRLANIYLEQGEIEKARQLNREVFSLLHENFNVEVVLGSASLQDAPCQSISLESSESLFDVASGNPFGAFRMERLEGLKKKYDRMIENFEAVLAENPSLIGVFESIILMHMVNEEYDAALSKCDRQAAILKNAPDIPKAQSDSLLAAVYNLKGGICLVTGERDRAEFFFQKAIRLAPNSLKPYYALARLYLAEKNLDKAISQYQALLENNPEKAGPHMMLGVLYKMKDDFARSEKHYRKALAIDPEFANAANNLAYLLSEQPDRLDEALTYALKAKSIEGDDPYIRDTLGWVYYQMGLYEDALRELKACVKKIPDNATVNYHLGMVHYRLGEMEEARRYLETALDLSERFYEAVNARKILNRIS